MERGYNNESKTERILTIYQMLCDGEYVNKASIADMFQVNPRSVQRDIDDLRAYFANQSISNSGVGPTILYDRSKNGYYLDYENERMTGSELLAVCKIILASRAFTKEELIPILNKLIQSCFSAADRKQVMELISNEEYHYIEPNHHTAFVNDLWEIGKAVKSHQVIRMQYGKLKEVKAVSRTVKPVGLLFSEFYFYLIAFIDKKESGEEEYLSPAIYRIDRIKSFQVLKKKFDVPYRDRFEEGEFRKRVQFMYGGPLQRITFEYSGLSLEAVLDRFPTAEILEERNDGIEDRKVYIVRVEVFGEGVDMWLRGQGDNIKIVSRKII